MNSYARNSSLSAYHSVSVHGGVANADPHGMVQMLLDAASERMAAARGCIERGEIARKASLLHSCVTLISELSGSLNMAEGGPLAQNLGALYDYMARQLLMANVESDSARITEVLSLLNEIRSAWIAIGPEVRKATPQAPPVTRMGVVASHG